MGSQSIKMLAMLLYPLWPKTGRCSFCIIQNTGWVLLFKLSAIKCYILSHASDLFFIHNLQVSVVWDPLSSSEWLMTSFLFCPHLLSEVCLETWWAASRSGLPAGSSLPTQWSSKDPIGYPLSQTCSVKIINSVFYQRIKTADISMYHCIFYLLGFGAVPHLFS